MAKEVTPQKGEIEEIKKIRDILFGSNMNEYEKRFSLLEQKLNNSLEDARQENEKRLLLLEDYVKQELKSLQEMIAAEKEARMKNEKRTQEDIAHIEEQANIFAEKTTKKFSETRSQILELGKSLGDKMNQQEKKLSEKISSVDSTLQSNYADRSSLALMFTDIARKLSGEPEEDVE